MEFHTTQSIGVCSLNVHYVQTRDVIHHKPLQTSLPSLDLLPAPSPHARSQPSVGAFPRLFGNSRADSQSVFAVTAPLAACPWVYPSAGPGSICRIIPGLYPSTKPDPAGPALPGSPAQNPFWPRRENLWD